MENIAKIALMILSTILISCAKEEVKINNTNVNSSTNVNITFNNVVSNIPINTITSEYTNAANNKYTVDLLKYYVTNVVLVNENGGEWLAKNYNLIDMSVPSQNTISLKNVPMGKYTKMLFILGVDSSRNTSGVQDGFLDPSYGMIWTWNTGYIFFKHEGTYTNSNNEKKPLRFHLGTSPARGFVNITLPAVNLKENTNTFVVNFDLNKAYSSKTIIDFNVDNDRQSSDPADDAWIVNMKNNLENSFSFVKAE